MVKTVRLGFWVITKNQFCEVFLTLTCPFYLTLFLLEAMIAKIKNMTENVANITKCLPTDPPASSPTTFNANWDK